MNRAQISLLVLAYLVGSIPTGYWFGRLWKGLDIRQHGSGNLGATNVFRILGPGPGLATLLFDIAKGFFPVWACQHFFPLFVGLAILAGLLAIAGHTLSLFVRFRGGKGVATAAGVFLALMPREASMALGVFALTFLISRIVSLSSIIGALALVLFAACFSPYPYEKAMAILVAAFIVWRHRANISRLMKGTEPRLEWRRPSA